MSTMHIEEGREEMFHLTTHSTHFIYGYMEGRREGNVLFNDALNTCYLRLYGRKDGNVLFNDALNTFYLRLYGVRHLVKDYSDSERGNPLPPHGLLFPINSKGSFICTIPHDRITHTTVVEHWLEREIAQWVHREGSTRRTIAP